MNDDRPDIWEEVTVGDLLTIRDSDTAPVGVPASLAPVVKPPNLYFVDFKSVETLEDLVTLLDYLELMVDYDSSPESIRPFLREPNFEA